MKDLDLHPNEYYMEYMTMPKIRQNVTAVLLYIINVIIAICINNIGSVINILGSTSIPFLIYVIPGFLY